MPTAPSPSSSDFLTGALRFFRRLGIIIAAGLGAALVAALALGRFNPFGISDMLFWASVVVLGLAVLPALTELGAGFSSMGKSLAGKEKAPPVDQRLAESNARRDKWLNNSVVFGAAGVLLFILSLLTATVFAGR